MTSVQATAMGTFIPPFFSPLFTSFWIRACTTEEKVEGGCCCSRKDRSSVNGGDDNLCCRAIRRRILLTSHFTFNFRFRGNAASGITNIIGFVHIIVDFVFSKPRSASFFGRGEEEAGRQPRQTCSRKTLEKVPQGPGQRRGSDDPAACKESEEGIHRPPLARRFSRCEGPSQSRPRSASTPSGLPLLTLCSDASQADPNLCNCKPSQTAADYPTGEPATASTVFRPSAPLATSQAATFSNS